MRWETLADTAVALTTQGGAFPVVLTDRKLSLSTYLLQRVQGRGYTSCCPST